MGDQPARILHVDDDEANRYAVTRSLRKAGFEVIEAGTGEEAMRKVATRPDLVILDVRLPDISGFEVCRRIKQTPHTAGIPILHLSASFVSGTDRAHGLDAGADAYLVRPVEPVELLATVNALLRARRSEEALRQSEERYRTLIRATASIVWSMPAAGEFLTPQPEWTAFTGQSFEQLRGRGWLDAVHPDDRAAVMEAWSSIETNNRLFEIEQRLRRHDGEYRFMLARALPLLDEAGAVREWIGIHADITERQRANAERQRLLDQERALRAEAEAANRLKDEFLATLSHELRTPLNAIVGWAAILQKTKISDEDLAEGLETIERNARIQTQLIEDLLDVSRIISGKLTLTLRRVDLIAVIEAAIATVYPAAEARGVHLIRALHPEGQMALGDPDRLQQVVWNLLSNAIKFTPRNGTVTIGLKRVGDQVNLTISDTGRGIEREFLPYVFDRFRQADASTRRSHGGLGLGLAIVRHLIELHGGAVSAASDGAGRGATFVVSLPASAAPPARAPQSPSPAIAPDMIPDRIECDPMLKGVRVLLVEDEEDSRHLLVRILELCEARTRAASSAADALAALGQGEFDVLISDIGMPGQDGYDLIRRIRALNNDGGTASRIPAIALTALARDDDRQRALDAGFQIHLSKPVEATALFDAILKLTRPQRTPTSALPTP